MKAKIEKCKSGVYLGISYTGKDWSYFKFKNVKEMKKLIEEINKQLTK